MRAKTRRQSPVKGARCSIASSVTPCVTRRLAVICLSPHRLALAAPSHSALSLPLPLSPHPHTPLIATMKILSLSLFTFPSPQSTTPTLLSQAADLSDYSFLTRGSVQEGLNFLAQLSAGRTADGQRMGVEEGGNVCSVYRKGDRAGPSFSLSLSPSFAVAGPPAPFAPSAVAQPLPSPLTPSNGHHLNRLPLPRHLLPPPEAPRRLLIRVVVKGRRRRQARRGRQEVPGPAPGRHHHEGPAGARRDQDCARACLSPYSPLP